jgi:hypothetical protein
LESQSSGREEFAGTTNPLERKSFFQKYKVGMDTSVSRLILATHWLLGWHHFFEDLLFELRAIEWHEFHLFRPLSGLNLFLQETGQLS